MVRKIVNGLICLLLFVGTYRATAQVAVTTGGAPTNYATLTAAFTAINNGTHTGAITITLTASHTLTAVASLNASGTGSANYSSISISPNTNVTITSAISNGFAIRFNGADNVTMDGLNGSGTSLTINNSGTGSSSVIYFVNGASNITINRCTLLSATTNWGNITIDSGSDDNNNLTISNCNIGPTDTRYRMVIYAYSRSTLT